jgi:phospholipid N-methyltransferase
MNATYSPEDNKLRLYTESRLSKEDYLEVKAAGFIWAPKQNLFVAPMWTPSREDFLTEFTGEEIGDEDTSLIERQEERAERFENYSDKRESEAIQAKNNVDNITKHIPFGQPILIGHHSEKRAQKDAERIENGMRKAIKLWETSEYWTERAKGALSHAKYKELPAVRVRRIKRIEADARKAERTIKEAEKFIKLWNETELTSENAKNITNYDYVSKCFTLAEFPRLTPDASTYEGMMSLYSALDGIITPEQAKEISIRVHERTIKHYTRWLQHYQNRLLYEETMLDQQGKSALLKPKARPKQLPLCNYKAPEGIQIENIYTRGEFSLYPQIEMTSEQWNKIYNDYKGTRIIENSHRVRIAFSFNAGKREQCCVFITDSKVHEKPTAKAKKEIVLSEPKTKEYIPKIERPEEKKFEALKDALKEGIKIVVADQLFPTPPEIAAKMVEYAEINKNHRVLEPSAGTGNILRAIGNAPDKVAIEINEEVAKQCCNVSGLHLIIGDFLEQNGNLGKFDRVIMNPPFNNAEDIKHIKHAITFLKPDGILVALCANGSRQNEILKPLADHWEVLPAGSFKKTGTNVNVALMIIRNN